MSGRPTPYSEVADLLSRLGLILREARRARGLSQRAAAAELHLSYSTISRIENGEDCDLSNAVTVIRWLDQTPRPAAPAPTVCGVTDPDSGKACDLEPHGLRTAHHVRISEGDLHWWDERRPA
jgi:DNA-binding XRE family transcriptional regulator